MVAKLTQSMIWADFILEREAIFKPVILRRILESPMIEKRGDILMTLSVTDARKKETEVSGSSFRAQRTIAQQRSSYLTRFMGQIQ